MSVVLELSCRAKDIAASHREHQPRLRAAAQVARIEVTISGQKMKWERTAEYWKNIPPVSTAIFLAAVFCLFGCFGVLQGLIQYRQGALARLLLVALSGGFAIGWALLVTRRLIPYMAILGIVQFVVTMKAGRLIDHISSGVDPRSDPEALKRLVWTDAGLASALLFASYMFTMEFLRRESTRYYTTHAEIRLANEIHRSLVPEISTTIGDFEFYGCSLPSGEVGGDVLDVIEVNGTWFAYVADVSGHGVPAGVLMTMLKSAARMRLVSAGTHDFMDTMNDVLAPLSGPTMFATMLCVTHRGNGQMALTSAGHLPILHYRSGTRNVEEHSVPNLPIGLFRKRIDYMTSSLVCGPGDILVLLTDGFTEVANRSGEELGFSPLKSLVVEDASRPLRDIAERLIQRANHHGKQTDDQTMLLIRCLPATDRI